MNEVNRRAATISHSQGLAPRFPAPPIPGLWRASSAEQRAMLEREYSLYVPASRCQSRPWIICGAPRPGLVRNAILKPPMDNMRRASWPATWGNRPAAHGFFAARRPCRPAAHGMARRGVAWRADSRRGFSWVVFLSEMTMRSRLLMMLL